MSKDRAIPHSFEGESLESVFVGRRDGQARPTVILVPTVMGVSDLEIGFGRQLEEFAAVLARAVGNAADHSLVIEQRIIHLRNRAHGNAG